jgi:site-specific recombinase XerD
MSKTILFHYDNELRREIDLRGLSYTTFKNYRSHLRRICEHFGKDIKEVSAEEVKVYLYHLKNNLNRHPQTLNVCRSAYIFFRQSVLGDNISPYSVPIHKFVYQLPDIIDRDTIMFILDTFSLKYKAVLSLCYGSGLRISEALAVQVSDIDSKNMKLYVRKSKGGKSRYSILSVHSLGCLRQYWKACRPAGPFLFPRMHNSDKPLFAQHVRLTFSKTYTTLFPLSHKKITTHTLRHCFATHLLDSGVDLRVIQALLGHKSIASTSIYTRLTDYHFSQLVSPLDRDGK